jgi:hypothetical protein
MGCDIHCYAEKMVSGVYKRIQILSPTQLQIV